MDKDKSFQQVVDLIKGDEDASQAIGPSTFQEMYPHVVAGESIVHLGHCDTFYLKLSEPLVNFVITGFYVLTSHGLYLVDQDYVAHCSWSDATSFSVLPAVSRQRVHFAVIVGDESYHFKVTRSHRHEIQTWLEGFGLHEDFSKQFPKDFSTLFDLYLNDQTFHIEQMEKEWKKNVPLEIRRDYEKGGSKFTEWFMNRLKNKGDTPD
jgi:ABC-type oligopeptide transport system ATPase subunit